MEFVLLVITQPLYQQKGYRKAKDRAQEKDAKHGREGKERLWVKCLLWEILEFDLFRICRHNRMNHLRITS